MSVEAIRNLFEHYNIVVFICMDVLLIVLPAFIRFFFLIFLDTRCCSMNAP